MFCKNNILYHQEMVLKSIAMMIFFTISLYSMEEMAGMLVPLEVHGRVIKKFFSLISDNNDNVRENINLDQLQKRILRMPLLLGVKLSREFCNLQKLCQSTIGKKKFLALELFCLPQQERDVMVRMKNRPIILDGDIGGKDFNILCASQRQDLLRGLVLEVNFVNSNVEYLERLAIMIAMVGALVSRLRASPHHTALIFFGWSTFLKGCVEVLNIFNPHFSMHTKWRRKKVEFKE